MGEDVGMKPVILDVDTGLDDACALLLAARHPDLDLLAVTCVGGNVGLDQVVVNTLTVLEAAGRTDVPVARGAATPLLQPVRAAPTFTAPMDSAISTGPDQPVLRILGTPWSCSGTCSSMPRGPASG